MLNKNPLGLKGLILLGKGHVKFAIIVPHIVIYYLLYHKKHYL
jgi:hypothetical protein